MGEEVRARSEAEPDVKVLSPSTRLVRSSPGRYVFEDLGEAAFRSDGKGGWEPVSFDAVLSPSGPVAASFGGTTVPTSFGRDGGPVVMFDVDGHQVRLGAVGLDIGEPEVSNGLVTYRDVAAGVDLRYAVVGDGVKEMLVLKDSSAPRSFRFHLADPDGVLGDPVRGEDGSLVWSGSAATDKQVVIPPAFAYASDVEGRLDPVRAQPSPLTASLVHERVADGWDLVLAVDPAWDAAQSGPVTLDPSIHYFYTFGRSGYGTMGKGAAQTASVWKDQGANRCQPGYACPPLWDNATATAAGTNSSFQQLRSVIRWNYNLDYATHRVNSAPYPNPGMNVPMRARIMPGTKLFLDQISCMGNTTQPAPGAQCAPAPDYLVAQNLSAPVTAASNWNTVGASVTGPVTYDLVVSPAAADRNDSFFFQGKWNSIDVRPMVQQWVDNPAAAHGLVLRSNVENATPRGEWHHSRYNRPSGCVNYDNATMNQPASSGYSCEATHPFLYVDFFEDAPYWSAAAPRPTVEVAGSTVNVTGTEADKGTYGIWYASALVNADNGQVARWSPISDLPAGGTVNASFADVPPGRYYVAEYAWNHATIADGTPAYGSTKSDLFNVGGTHGQATGAGREPWWNFEDKAIGPQAVAGVNVGNGNLVVQHADTTAVQGHGRLSLGVERAYNSTAPDPVGLTGVGRGWSFVTSGVGDGVLDGVGLMVDPVGLSTQPVTMVDRDGTRHAFTRNRTDLRIELGQLGPSGFTAGSDPLASLLGSGDQVGGLVEGLVTSVKQTLAKPDTLFEGGVRVCVDTSYSSPTGVNLSLWRFVGVAVGDPCPDTTTPSEANPLVVLGYATVSPDRMRQVYSLSGKLVSVIDPAGNELRYEYGIISNVLGLNGTLNVLQTPLSHLRRIYDPKACLASPVEELLRVTVALTPTPDCRQLTFDYPALVGALGATVVTDPAGRVTTYSTDPVTQTLSKVETRSAAGELLEAWSYTYQGVANANCGGTPGQMCSVTAPNGATTTFTYQDGKVVTLRDRAGPDETAPAALAKLTTTFAYTAGAGGGVDQTDVTQDGRGRRYAGIDGALRVSDLYAGSPQQLAANQGLSHVRQVWDGSEAGGASPVCQPAADQTGSRLNHNLCSSTTFAGALATTGAPQDYAAPADQVVDFEYTPEGYVLSQARRLAGAERLVTRNRYLVSVHTLGGTAPTQATEGLGAASVDRPADTKFVIVDRTGTQTPAGNQTFWDVDANPAVPVGKLSISGTTSTCGQKPRTAGPAPAGGNTGLVCHVRAPAVPAPATDTANPNGASAETPRDLAFADPYAVEVETRTHDTYGQTDSVTDSTGATTRHTYYTDSDRDLTGKASAGGWLRTTVDPTGAFVAFAYDRAGNVARTWDRNATRNLAAADFGSSASLDSPPSPRYTEVQMADKATAREAFENPWRYPGKTRTAKGEVTNVTVDAHGNNTETETPLGLKTKREFNTRDGLVIERLPETPDAPSTYVYDGERRLTAVIDAEGHVVTAVYDPAGRRSETRFTRGPWAQATQQEKDGGCRESTTGDGPIPAGRTLCTTRTTYSGAGQPVAVTDASGAPAWTSYDGAGRVTDTWAFRSTGKWLRSSQSLDGDGKVLTACSPRQRVMEPGVACGPTAHYSTHTTYDGLARPTTVVTHRERLNGEGGIAAPGQQQDWERLEARQEYDAANRTVKATDPRGSTTTTRLDVRGRRIEMVRPRSGSLAVTTSWGYDDAGNTTSSTVRLGAEIDAVTAWRFDENNRLVDTVEAASSPEAAADQDTYRAVTAPSTQIANLRTRSFYDKDGRTVGTLDSRAFTASVTAPDLRYLARTDLDGNSRPVAQWAPLWDELAAKPLDGGPERTECPLLASIPEADRPDQLTGVPSYPAGVGVCVQRAEYHDTGRLKTTRSATGDAEQFQVRTWTDDGLLKSVEGPNPDLTDPSRPRILTERRAYDGVGRPVRTLDAVPFADTTEYGYATEIVWTSDGLAKTVSSHKPGSSSVDHRQDFEYDENGQPLETRTLISDGQTDTTKGSWYADGLQREQISPSPNSYTNRWAYDPNGNPTSVWSPSAVAKASNNTAGAPITHGYTADNLLERTTQPVSPSGSLRRVTDYTYDSLSRKTSQQVTQLDGTASQDGGTQSFTWSPNGWGLTETGRFDQGTIQRDFDATGRLTRVVDQSSASTATVDIDRLLNGAAVKVKTTAADVTATRFSWHADGLQQRLEAGSGDMATVDSTQTTAYNDARLPVSTTTTGWGGNSQWSATKYDQAGRPLERKDPNDRTTKWSWFDDSQPKTTSLHDAQGVLDSWEVKTRDKVGRPTSIERQLRDKPAAETRNFGYDKEGRVIPAEGKTVEWDPDGNRSQYGDPVGHRADGSLAAATYDPAGNQTVSGCRTNTFDGFDRLKGTTGCDKPAVAYTYDALDRQTTITTGTASRRIRYAGTADTVLAEHDDDPNKTATYLLGPAGDALGVVNGNGVRQILHTDIQGNTVLATTANSVDTCEARFNAWGEPEPDNACQQPGKTPNTRWYNQDRSDSTTGTYQNGARTYDPAQATWLSADAYRTAAQGQDLSVTTDPLTRNRYSYVNGDPINLHDPDGHKWTWKKFTHVALDTAGLVPLIGEFADLANCAFYAIEGNKVDAPLSCASAIPLAGYAATAAKAARYADEALAAGKIAKEAAEKKLAQETAQRLAQEKAAKEAADKARQEAAEKARKAAEQEAAKKASAQGAPQNTKAPPASPGAGTASPAAPQMTQGGLPTFAVASNGEALALNRILIPGPLKAPQGKVDFLMGRVSSAKSASRGKFFAGRMGFDDASLDAALRGHLIDNFHEFPAGPGTFAKELGRLRITAPITGPSGMTSKVTSVWSLLRDGHTSFITAW